MLDPGALGTLLIWLDIDDQHATTRRRRSRPVAAPRREGTAIRLTLARGLRRAASAIERPALREVAG
jgi:hypothetical protein